MNKCLFAAAPAIVLMTATAHAQMDGGQGSSHNGMMGGGWGWGGMGDGWGFSGIIIVLLVVFVVVYAMKRK